MIAQRVKNQNFKKWMKNSAADSSARQFFFGSLIAQSNKLHKYMDLDANAVTCNVPREIVYIFIGQRLLCDDNELAATGDDEQNKLASSNHFRKVSKLKHNAMSLLNQ